MLPSNLRNLFSSIYFIDLVIELKIIIVTKIIINPPLINYYIAYINKCNT